MIEKIIWLAPRLIILFALIGVFLSNLLFFIENIKSPDVLVHRLVVKPIETGSRMLVIPFFIIAILYPSPGTFLLVCILDAIAWGSFSTLMSIRTLLTVLLLSIVDHIAKYYRREQEKYVKIGNPFGSTILLLVIITPLLVTPFALNGYLELFITTAINSMHSRDPLLGLLVKNPFFIMIFSLAIGVATYSFIESFSDTLAIYLIKPKQNVIEKLRDQGDINVYLDTPLSSIKTLLIAAIFAPPIFRLFDTVIMPQIISNVLHRVLHNTPDLIIELIRGLMGFVLFLLIWIVAGRVFHGIEVYPKITLALSLTSLLSLYLIGVISIIQKQGITLQAILAPDLEAAVAGLVETYIYYFATELLLFESVLKLMGVIP